MAEVLTSRRHLANSGSWARRRRTTAPPRASSRSHPPSVDTRTAWSGSPAPTNPMPESAKTQRMGTRTSVPDASSVTVSTIWSSSAALGRPLGSPARAAATPRSASPESSAAGTSPTTAQRRSGRSGGSGPRHRSSTGVPGSTPSPARHRQAREQVRPDHGDVARRHLARCGAVDEGVERGRRPRLDRVRVTAAARARPQPHDDRRVQPDGAADELGEVLALRPVRHRQPAASGRLPLRHRRAQAVGAVHAAV